MKKKKAKIIITIATIVLIGGVAAFYFLFAGPKERLLDVNMPRGMRASQAEVTASGEIFGAYGITSITTVDVKFPVEGMTSSLEVEEVYTESGKTVTLETPIVKFTDESVATVREELEDAVREKELAYRAAKIEYEQNKITYQYDKMTTELEGEQAEKVYNETISSLSASVDRAKETLDDANEQIAEYDNAIANNKFYNDYVEALKQYDDDLDALSEKLSEWGVSWNEVTRGVRENYATLHDQYVTILSRLYSALEVDEKVLSEARTAYEESTTTKAAEIQLLRLSISRLEADYASAKQTYETNLLEANLTKEQTKNKASMASEEYETNMEKAEADFNNSEEDYIDAKEALETFEACAGTGIYYASKEGTILRTGVRKGRSITSDSSIYTVSDKTGMTVSVSVGQSDIAKITVGDSAYVYSENSGTYTAVISEINPIASSRQSSVTYNVTLEMTGEFSSLSNNETVTVYFGMGGTT